MIDTVHFRIHDLQKNAKLKHQLSTTDKKGSTTAEISQSTLESLQGDKIRVHLFHDSGNILPLVRRSNLNIPSSHYSVSYVIHEIRDYIEFNVAIPKYEWGTNILQYIPYYDQSPQAMFNLLRSFFFKFFKNFTCDPDTADIEIVRLDMCYNQFFVDKNQALTYLNCQKELAVKYARSSKNNYRTYETSLFYQTRRYTFKIYHKGTEFTANDKKELAKHKVTNLSIPKLQYEADRILRYEMTFRPSYFDYVLKNDIVFKEGKKSSYTDVFTRMLRHNNVTASKVIDSFKRKQLSFYLKSLWDVPVSDLNQYIENHQATFNNDLFFCMYERFWKKVQDYQLNIPMTPYDVLAKINEHNGFVDTKNQFAAKKQKQSPKEHNRLLILAMLSQYMDVENLKKYLPKSSFFRMKAELNKLGINMYNNNHTIPAPPTDYLEYKYIFGNKFNLTLK
ncbi:phage replication protein CRI [Arcticibacter pallidicorallinus]|uniref:Phage replication protein CRI n=1 Tax=Arcticibacter pallidicorallinus TaxID=1259464 RepID=A0A2T0TXL5_9SPHI|nr:phage/plasmid replication protein [Arcticibacter pallidicorallinus]PRY50393.1 phage replication protein CRI [Arcticibacter pallidicorallinus]